MAVTFTSSPDAVVKAMDAQIQNDLKYLLTEQVNKLARPIIESIVDDIASQITAKMSLHADYSRPFADRTSVVIAINGEILKEKT